MSLADPQVHTWKVLSTGLGTEKLFNKGNGQWLCSGLGSPVIGIFKSKLKTGVHRGVWVVMIITPFDC